MALLLPGAVVIAFLSFVNAASGIGALPFDRAAHSGWLGLSGQALSLRTEDGFEQELARHQAQLVQGEIPRLSRQLVATAKASYAVNPLDVSSLRTIALGEVRKGNNEQVRELMRIAARISKRDSMVDLWLAQDYGKLGDTNAMLASFDVALRTSMSVRSLTIKPVVETLANRASFAPLGRMLSHHPEWETDFWHEFVRNPVSIANAASFLMNDGISLSSIPQNDRQVLYRNIRQAKDFDMLFRLAALNPGINADEDALAAGQFVTVDQGDPLGWALYSTGTAAASVLRKSSVLEIDAQPGSFGDAADRIVSLHGAQSLTIQMAAPMPNNAILDVLLECANVPRGRLLADIRLSQGEKSGQIAFSSIGCDYGRLQVSFRVDEGLRAAQMRIARVTVDNVSRGGRRAEYGMSLDRA